MSKEEILEPNLTVEEAGRRGGLSTLQRRGKIHFATIGHLGQRVMRSKYPNKASAWGKLGGRPKKLSLGDMGEARINENKEGADPPSINLLPRPKFNRKCNK